MLYYYTARNAQGTFVRGSIEAGSEGNALAGLRSRALFITSIERSNGPRGALAAVLHFGAVSEKSLAVLFRSFATLVGSGVSIRRALDVAIEQCADSRLREVLAATANDVENGLPLSDAMARHPREFPRLLIATVRAGEAGGVLDQVLERLAGTLERESAIRKRMKASLAYPAVVACAAIGLVTFLLLTIVPMFRAMYDQMHVPLPRITTALLVASSAARSPAAWLTTLALAASLSFAFLQLRRSDAGSVLVDSMLLRIPVAGAIARKATAARFARMFGTLLRSGVGLLDALDVATDLVKSAPYRRSLDELRKALSEGSTLIEPLTRSRMYDPLFLQMVHAGEETGALDSMLLRVADYYELDVETALANLGALLEPAMILILGTVVGFIVSAIFIPLYTLIGNMK